MFKINVKKKKIGSIDDIPLEGLIFTANTTPFNLRDVNIKNNSLNIYNASDMFITSSTVDSIKRHIMSGNYYIDIQNPDYYVQDKH